MGLTDSPRIPSEPVVTPDPDHTATHMEEPFTPIFELRILSGLLTRSVGYPRYATPVELGCYWSVFDSHDGSLRFSWSPGWIFFPPQGDVPHRGYSDNLSGGGFRLTLGLEWVFGLAEDIRVSIGGGLRTRFINSDEFGGGSIVGRVSASLQVPLARHLDFVLTTAMEGGFEYEPCWGDCGPDLPGGVGEERIQGGPEFLVGLAARF